MGVTSIWNGGVPAELCTADWSAEHGLHGLRQDIILPAHADGGSVNGGVVDEGGST